jgi:hypothetical protein
MSLQPTSSRLMAATRELLSEWGRTRDHWRDAKGAEFERRYIAEIPAAVGDAIRAITELDKQLAKIRHDCE